MRMNRESGGPYINLLSYTNLFAFFNDPPRLWFMCRFIGGSGVGAAADQNPVDKARAEHKCVQWPMFILIKSNE